MIVVEGGYLADGAVLFSIAVGVIALLAPLTAMVRPERRVIRWIAYLSLVGWFGVGICLLGLSIT